MKNQMIHMIDTESQKKTFNNRISKPYSYNKFYEDAADKTYKFFLDLGYKVFYTKDYNKWNSLIDRKYGDFTIIRGSENKKPIYTCVDAKVNSVTRSSILYGNKYLVYIILNPKTISMNDAIVVMHSTASRLFRILEKSSNQFFKRDDIYPNSDKLLIYKYHQIRFLRKALTIKAWIEKGFPIAW